MSKTCHQVTTQKKPDWLKIRFHNNETFGPTAVILERLLHTIRSGSNCPKKAECGSRYTAMILSNICTRRDAFCAAKGRGPLPPDNQDPARVAGSIRLMERWFVVVTSVTCDDLSDREAALWNRPDSCCAMQSNWIVSLKHTGKNTNNKIKKNDYANHKTLGGKAARRPCDSS